MSALKLIGYFAIAFVAACLMIWVISGSVNFVGAAVTGVGTAIGAYVGEKMRRAIQGSEAGNG